MNHDGKTGSYRRRCALHDDAEKDIVFDHVTKSYGQVQVIQDLTFQVKAGERLAVLGSSGCGKSTLLRMVAGLEDVTSGNLMMGGVRMNDVPSGERGVSMVFQNYALYPHMTVARNITYALRAHKMGAREIEQRLDDVLQIMRLEPYRDRLPRELSGGQRQRVALARALVNQAPYLLLDEPLSNLDAQLRATARKELVRIHQIFGQTFLYVTHDQVEAMTVGDRIALMNDGVLQMLDTPFRVYNRPANVFVARFIGSPAMNIMPAQVQDGALWVCGQRIDLPDMWQRMVEKHGADKLLLGVRPERFRLVKAVEGKGDQLRGTIRYVEDYGNRLGFYLTVGDTEVSVMSGDADYRPGDTVGLQLDFFHIHLFDAQSERSLSYPEEVDEGLKMESRNAGELA